MRVLGIDVGGANLKYVVIRYDNGKHVLEEVHREYFPLWRRGREALERRLRELSRELSPDYASICMTAELCDIYESKTEGVIDVVEKCCEAFGKDRTLFVSCDLELLEPDEALKHPLKIAAANWAASAWLVSKLCRDCVFADIGSTTTTIILVLDGRPQICGKTDPEKLICGELVYLGTLRTSVSEIVDRLPYKGNISRICREYFSIMADVNLLLGKISSEEYYIDTPDGRGKSLKDAALRLARVACSSLEYLNMSEIVEIARYVYDIAIGKITESFIQVRTRAATSGKDTARLTLVTAGIGEFMLRDAGIRAGFSNIVSIDDIVREPLKIATAVPSYGAAMMLIDHVRTR
ncbi:MAG: hypothetical protein GXO23_01840 [Crenarchaeota archaeon]|nr:hypothetical protein [Thermoproteota archaeon]